MADEAPKEKKEKERCLNVILVGDCSVGKTAIIRRFV
jgi:small GTP-binding protein